jgi:hypothetical protein
VAFRDVTAGSISSPALAAGESMESQLRNLRAKRRVSGVVPSRSNLRDIQPYATSF